MSNDSCVLTTATSLRPNDLVWSASRKCYDRVVAVRARTGGLFVDVLLHAGRVVVPTTVAVACFRPYVLAGGRA